MLNRRYKKYGLLLLILSVAAGSSVAQNQSAVSAELNKIYKLYDSAVYLSFNTKYEYTTDTVLGREKHETLSGGNILYGSRSFCWLGSIDMLRNDSFSLAAYNDQKFIVATKLVQSRGASQVLPMRGTMDSLMQSYYEHYNVSMGDTLILNKPDTLADTLKQILFVCKPADSLAQYNFIKITYRPVTYILSAYEYGLEQPFERREEDTASLAERPWKVRFRISFDNYRVGSTDIKMFSEARMIREEAPGVWIASGNYAGYTLYWASDKTPRQIVAD